MQEFFATATDAPVCFLGECCRYDEVSAELTWVDLEAGLLYRARASGPEVEVVETLRAPGALGALAPYEARERGWLAAVGTGLGRLAPDGSFEALLDLEPGRAGIARMNDGTADPWGRFYIGSMAYGATPGAGRLYRYDPASGEVKVILEGTTISNGLGFSPDRRTLYYVDSGPATLDRFTLDATGEPSGRETLVAFAEEEGAPDGLCVDVEGAIWVALWGGSAVRRYSPGGELLAICHVEALQPASCAIGGASGTTLYVTTAQEDLTPEQLEGDPLAGRLFSAEVAVAGAPLEVVRP